MLGLHFDNRAGRRHRHHRNHQQYHRRSRPHRRHHHHHHHRPLLFSRMEVNEFYRYAVCTCQYSSSRNFSIS